MIRASLLSRVCRSIQSQGRGLFGNRLLSSSAVTRLEDWQMVPSIPQFTSYASSFREKERIKESGEQLLFDHDPEMGQVRQLPLSKAYYTLSTNHEETINRLRELYRQNSALPKLPKDEFHGITWTSYEVYSSKSDDRRVTKRQYSQLIEILNQLGNIHPDYRSRQVQVVIQQYADQKTSKESVTRVKELDELGRAYAIGRRKMSSAQVWMVKGQGKVLVNGKSLSEQFDRLGDRELATWPLRVVASETDYNIFAHVSGGGYTGQSGALALGIARALVIHNPGLHHRLYKAGCLTRDRRRVERKKPGKLKARKAPTWVKR